MILTARSHPVAPIVVIRNNELYWSGLTCNKATIAYSRMFWWSPIIILDCLASFRLLYIQGTLENDKTDSFRFRETITASSRTAATHHKARFCPPRGVTRSSKRTRLDTYIVLFVNLGFPIPVTYYLLSMVLFKQVITYIYSTFNLHWMRREHGEFPAIKPKKAPIDSNVIAFQKEFHTFTG